MYSLLNEMKFILKCITILFDVDTQMYQSGHPSSFYLFMTAKDIVDLVIGCHTPPVSVWHGFLSDLAPSHIQWSTLCNGLS